MKSGAMFAEYSLLKNKQKETVIKRVQNKKCRRKIN